MNIRKILFRRNLVARDQYIFDLMTEVQGSSYWAIGIKQFCRRPSRNKYLAMLKDLSEQQKDHPEMIEAIIGTELALMVALWRKLYSLPMGLMPCNVYGAVFLKVDLCKMKRGNCFTMIHSQEGCFEVIANRPKHVDYKLAGVGDAPLRTYPKEEGPVMVYLMNRKTVAAFGNTKTVCK